MPAGSPDPSGSTPPPAPATGRPRSDRGRRGSVLTWAARVDRNTHTDRLALTSIGQCKGKPHNSGSGGADPGSASHTRAMIGGPRALRNFPSSPPMRTRPA